ncbi:M61 family metallopeptidase [Shewanella avicenniae]|uniref:M61 family metallopeptidase n=1 Tax=Shewanella avicenniae TaxID=2814294 RepID=A0ABX7QLN0_9GAMM|nr:M61 family metallopeptidase [Shewanella avicenniae]QSX32354.1 M61 family metallopeptidase [Shewanella avicenniae]
MISYQITAVDPVAHLFEVSMRVDAPAKQQEFWLPAWLPGSYMIRDFAKNIIGLRASDEINRPLAISQLDKQRWLIESDAKVLHLRYQIYAWDLSVRTAHLDQTHGFFNGSSVFLAVRGQELNAHEVEILPPASFSDWQVATTLPRIKGDDFGFGRFRAADYDELIDHPVEMGTFTLGSFEACGVRHDVVLTGRHHCHMPRLLKDLTEICESQIKLFGTPAPFERYLFMTQVLKSGFGGLEHRASTALHCARNELPKSMDAPVDKDYRSYLTLCSHEYFHSWNVKRIKPKAFIPYQLEAETYTPQLWAYEGITSYYDDLMTYRSGRVDKQSYLELLSQTFTRVYRGVGRLTQSLSDSSFNAWTKFYKQDENAGNAIVSYYTKGGLFALYLDLTLRLETQGEKTLDDLMRLLWQRFGLTGIGTDDDSHQQLYSELLGRDASAEFAWINKAEDLPLAELLAKFGVEMKLRPSSSNSDQGGGDADGLKVGFGAKYKAEGLGVRIVSVANGSPAHKAGLSAKDLLIAADGLQAGAQFEQFLQLYQEKNSITLHWFRDDVLMSGELPIEVAANDTVSLLIRDEEKIKAWLD